LIGGCNEAREAGVAIPCTPLSVCAVREPEHAEPHSRPLIDLGALPGGKALPTFPRCLRRSCCASWRPLCKGRQGTFANGGCSRLQSSGLVMTRGHWHRSWPSLT
jgi:hypothetical protein